MTGDFLPEWNCIAVRGGYVGVFKRFTTDDWHMVRDEIGVRKFATAPEAIAAAKELIRAELNPAILAERAFEAEARAFKAGKADAMATLKSVFGQAPAAIYAKGKSIPVEVRRAKCR